MLNIIILIGLAANIAILLFVFRRLQQTIRESAHLAQQGSAEALVEKIEKVGKGDTKGKIERLLGRADSLNDKEWVYYLDEYSGYAINFDSRDRVESVNSWRA